MVLEKEDAKASEMEAQKSPIEPASLSNLGNMHDPFANQEKEFIEELQPAAECAVVENHSISLEFSWTKNSDTSSIAVLKNLSNTYMESTITISKLKQNLDHITQERNEARAEAVKCKEEIDVLINSINLASKLASLPPESYTHKDPREQGDCSTCQSPSSLQAQLDNLQSTWKLEETSIPSLMSSIHRLQSNITHLQAAADSALPTNQLLQADNLKYSNELKVMKMAITKLYKDNVKLKQRLTSAKDKKSKFVQNIKECMRMTIEEEVEKERMKIYESSLKGKKKQQYPLNKEKSLQILDDTLSSENGTEKEPSFNRQRTSTCDSAFSDISCDMEPRRFAHELEGANDQSGSLSSGDCDVSSSSSVSSCSTFSLVTDECLSTLRLAPSLSSKKKQSFTGLKKSSSYTLKFPVGVKVGLQFDRIELTNQLDPETSRSRAFSDGFIHCRSIPENQAQMKKESPKAKVDKMVHTFLDRGEPSSTNKVSNGYEFLVSGFESFDTKMNIRPTIGAKLVAINENPIMRSDWTIDDLNCYLDANQRGKELSLTFRNEGLKKQQKDIFKKPIFNITHTAQKVVEKSDNVPNKLKVRLTGSPIKKSSFMKSSRASFFEKNHPSSFFSSKPAQQKITDAKKCSNNDSNNRSFLAKLKALDHKTKHNIDESKGEKKECRRTSYAVISLW